MLQRDAAAITTAAITLAKAAPMPQYDASASSTAAVAGRGQAHARRVDDKHITNRPINSPGPSPLDAGIILNI